MEYRYYYVGRSGATEGPVLLSTMRRLWQHGQIAKSTEICRAGTDDWETAAFFPEIVEHDSNLPTAVIVRMAKAKSNPWRLTVWMVLLGLAFATYLLQQWIKKL